MAGHPHYMRKEIYEQPHILQNVLEGRLSPAADRVSLAELGAGEKALLRAEGLIIIACGTSWHAGMVGRNMIERVARIPVGVEYAAEFRYRDPVITPGTACIAISQSGETADTLAAARLARGELGMPMVTICNVPGSSITRETDGTLLSRCGPEIAVASTKAFTAQILLLDMIAVAIGMSRGRLEGAEAARRMDAMRRLPVRAEEVLALDDRVRSIAERFAEASNFLYLGRGTGFPLALEGALKLKEISYVHAEGCHAAEMKHGPIALIDEKMPVVAIALRGRRYEKILNNIHEVRARGARVIALASAGDEEIRSSVEEVIPIPDDVGILNSVLCAIPLQLLAYHIAVLRGCQVDQPRNLAKSVTVE